MFIFSSPNLASAIRRCQSSPFAAVRSALSSSSAATAQTVSTLPAVRLRPTAGHPGPPLVFRPERTGRRRRMLGLHERRRRLRHLHLRPYVYVLRLRLRTVAEEGRLSHLPQEYHRRHPNLQVVNETSNGGAFSVILLHFAGRLKLACPKMQIIAVK